MCNLKVRDPLISDSRSVTVKRQSAGLSATVFLTLTLLFMFTKECFLFPNPRETLLRRDSQDCSSISGSEYCWAQYNQKENIAFVL